MIRILTVHHESDKFLLLQKKYLETYTNSSYVVYCGHSGFSPVPLGDRYQTINLDHESHHHSLRLNKLYDHAKADFRDSDIIIFMDSDSFPISMGWETNIPEILSDYPITAIQRKENSSSPRGCLPEFHPHPCFFCTTYKFWADNNLSFNTHETAGYDIELWLKENNMDFKPILRSNAVNLHPLYFGVYGDLIYHHGAGNRLPYDGVDICARPKLGGTPDLDLRYPKIPVFNQKLSELVFEEINNDDDFIRNFLMGAK